MMDYRATVNARRIAFGPSDRLMTMAQIKYPWAIDIYDTMESNTWFQRSIPMGEDKDCYRQHLSPQERLAYDRALAFVSNLDGIQFNNLIHNIGQHITAPEVSLALARQAAEEGVHVRAYQTMIEAVSMNPEYVYMMFQRDGMLAQKNEYIMRQSDVLKEEPTPANFARALVSNIILEGVYFYSAFLVFYVLARNGKMLASADMVKYIQRDEGGTHLELFTQIHRAFGAENPGVHDADFWEDARTLFMEAAALEVLWGQYVIGAGIQGLTPSMVESFVRDMANKRWALLRPDEVLFPGVINPAPWFDDFSRPNSTRQNFFERKVVDYSADGLEW